MKIISAEQRLTNPGGITICIAGEAGIGKTSLLADLPEQDSIFIDLEAGGLCVRKWQGQSIQMRSWHDLLELEKNLESGSLARFKNIFIDSVSRASSLCFEAQKAASSSKEDMRSIYGKKASEFIRWVIALHHAPQNIFFTCRLLEQMDEYNKKIFTLGIEGAKARMEFPAIIDQLICMSYSTSERVFICKDNKMFPTKDRSGKLSPAEPANLEKLINKINDNKISG